MQIGNEQAMDQDYVDRFTTLGAAIWSKDPSITLVVSQNLSADPNDWTIGPNGETSDLLKLASQIVKFGADHHGAIWWDCHYHGYGITKFRSNKTRIGAMTALRESVAVMFPEYDRFKLAPLEENGPGFDMKRAVVHAANVNAFMRMGDVAAVGVANTFQASEQDLIWSQGRTHFDAEKTWFQPPYYVDQMIHRNWGPRIVKVECESEENALNVVARIDTDGRTLIVQVVNLAAIPVAAKVSISNFVPDGPTAQIIQLIGDPDGTNSADAPTRIAPKKSDWEHQISSGNATLEFAPYSFTLIRIAGRQT